MAAFKLGIPSVTKTITLHRPGLEPEEFTAEIRVRSVEEQDELDKQRQAGQLKDSKHVRADVLAVHGVVDANDKEAASSAELIDAVFNDPYALVAISVAWGEVQRGVSELTAKN